ncbi:HisA/HisF-related TIM barrel protein [Arcobacter arenosus]|uniref:Imidazole glycerol phosphate synthase subunit HisF n=1 Tax=Arcobacter arenosus TaxID=2576037 RepID=A0A5R8Y0Z5_9BACT|nr:HisA/HisF-related TIM barrel protein [Arcobacter arenosus]TLP38521.1 imidazole glycerol phosphate synthase subunit HisF [Arcobacter arenosus]
MIPLRISPVILLSENKVIKTKQFKFDRYIGDPINSIKIFNQKNVDELIILDKSAINKNMINFQLLKDMVDEFTRPISYGGNISNIEDAFKLINLGIEKLIIGRNSFDYDFISKLINLFGSQSVSVCLDIVNVNNEYFLFDYKNNLVKNENLQKHIKVLINLGIGEIVINSVNHDGMMMGYDTELLSKFKELNCELIALGGMGSLDDIVEVINNTNIKAFAIGSYFLYLTKLKSVLLQYLSLEDREYIIKKINNGHNYV